MNCLSGTTIERLTPPGRGAVAIFHLSGTDAFRIFQKGFRYVNGSPIVESEIEPRSTKPIFGFFLFDDAVREEVVVHLRAADSIEINTHGGERIAARLFRWFADEGVLLPEKRKPLSISEEVLELLPSARTERTAALLLAQFRFDLEQELDRIDADPVTRSEKYDQLLKYSEIGKHLLEPFLVLLVGPVNVGKSSLLNSFLGFDRAIVDSSAGTTRDPVIVETVFDGWPIRLIDTAGLRGTEDLLEREGIERTNELFSKADLLLFLIDPKTKGAAPWQEALRLLGSEAVAHFERLQSSNRFLPVMNKIDLPRSEWAQEWCGSGEELVMKISVQEQRGLESLRQEIIARLLPEPIRQTDRLDLFLPFTSRQRNRIEERRLLALTARELSGKGE